MTEYCDILNYAASVQRLGAQRPASQYDRLACMPKLFLRVKAGLCRMAYWFGRCLLGNRRMNSWQQFIRGKYTDFRLQFLLKNGHQPILAYVVPYDIVKLQTGGGKRIAGISKAISSHSRVFILSLSPSCRPFSLREVCPDVWMLAIPASRMYEEKVDELGSTHGGASALMTFADHFDLLPEFSAVLERLRSSVRFWMLASPVVWPVIRSRMAPSAGVLYDVHDNCLHFYRNCLQCRNETTLQRVSAWEREVFESCKAAMFCTLDDRDAALARSPKATAAMGVVPNGVDVADCACTPPSLVRNLRRRVGMAHPVVLFAGANFAPNHEAVDYIVRTLAPAFPQVVFVAMGMHFGPYRADGGAEPGANVVFTGRVSEDIKEAIFSLADIALAPMKSGTGSSLKIPDYVAHGKVVIGTPIGLRGFDTLLQFPSVIAEEDVCGALARMLKRLDEDVDSLTESCRAAREWVQFHLDWSVAAMPLLDLLEGAQGVESPAWSSIP